MHSAGVELDNDISSEEELPNDSEIFTNQEKRINILKNHLIQLLGNKQFEDVYNYLKKERVLSKSTV